MAAVAVANLVMPEPRPTLAVRRRKIKKYKCEKLNPKYDFVTVTVAE